LIYFAKNQLCIIIISELVYLYTYYKHECKIIFYVGLSYIFSNSVITEIIWVYYMRNTALCVSDIPLTVWPIFLWKLAWTLESDSFESKMLWPRQRPFIYTHSLTQIRTNHYMERSILLHSEITYIVPHTETYVYMFSICCWIHIVHTWKFSLRQHTAYLNDVTDYRLYSLQFTCYVWSW